MKKNSLPYFGILALGMAIAGSTNQTETKKILFTEPAPIITPAAEKYSANVTESTINWKGYKPTGSHAGTINLEKGELIVNNGSIESGVFTIDMATIEDEGNNERLENHLKSADFFDVENFPKAKFDITSATTVEDKTMLTGDLTIKNVTNTISFSVTISKNGDAITLSSETFTIDRAKWDIKTRSKSFFTNLGDKLINDDMEITIMVKADKS